MCFFYGITTNIGVLKSFAIFKGKSLFWSIFWKISQACIFIKKRLQHICFPVKIAKFLRTTYVTKHLRWHVLDPKEYDY